jgi:hypothetical protein
MNTVLTDVQNAAALLLDELNCEDEPRESSPPPMVLPPLHPSSSEPSAVSTPHGRSRVLPRLLAMADTYRKGGSLRQAIELYFEIVREHAGTPQAFQAEDRLIDVARSYEQAGELRQARGIYEQLI